MGKAKSQRTFREAVARLLLAALGLAGCSLAFPLGSLDDGVSCPPGQKPCEGACVSRDDPAHGCGTSSCASCGIPNAQARCNAEGACDFAACVGHYSYCDASPLGGCLVDIGFDPDNCGACGRVCALAHAQPGCSAGACVILECDPGYADCDQDPGDGCETSLADLGCDGGEPCDAATCPVSPL